MPTHLSLIAALALAAGPKPESFSIPPGVEAMKLSPDGRFLALVVPQSDYESRLLVLDAASLKAVGGLNSSPMHQVGDFWWVSDERLLIAEARKYGGLDEPLLTGRLMAVDADGKRVAMIYGANGEQSVGTRMKTRADDNGFATLVDPLIDDPKRAVVAIWPPVQDVPYTEVYSIDVRNGSRRKLAKAPLANAEFMLGAGGEPQYAWGVTTEGWQRLYLRTEGDDWRLVNDESQSGIEVHPLAPAGADGSLPVQIRPPKGPGHIAQWHPDNGELKTLHQPERAEPAGALLSADGQHLYGVYSADGRDDLALIDTTLAEGKLVAALRRSFKDALVEPLSWSRDGALALLRVRSDRNSGEYYLYDRNGGKARFLLARDEWADPDAMRPRQAVTIAARDGLQLPAFLTLPATEGEAKPPLVLLIHGGPHGVRDEWLWDPWAQLLASQGMAVLQVNYRGSGGYGQDFGAAGYRQWGGAVIDDLIDATRWAIEQGHVDGSRVCAVGASFGGYAALMSAAREPDLFRCAMSYAGVSDLRLMHRKGDIQRSDRGESYLDRVIGRDEDELARYSPVTQAGAIKAAVMLAHGGEDERVPLAHAEAMKSALEKAGKPVEWLLKPNEAHGFYRQAHRAELNQRMLDFLARHLKAADDVAAE